MTEEIIIDGINVAGCEYKSSFDRECYSDVDSTECQYCDENPNCYYKQLKRLEQENKELKENIEAFKTMATVPTRMYNECERERCRYGRALEEILESAKFAQCLPCGSGNLEDCLNCNDDTTNNGQFCMEKRIHEIKTKCVEVLNESK